MPRLPRTLKGSTTKDSTRSRWSFLVPSPSSLFGRSKRSDPSHNPANTSLGNFRVDAETEVYELQGNSRRSAASLVEVAELAGNAFESSSLKLSSRDGDVGDVTANERAMELDTRQGFGAYRDSEKEELVFYVLPIAKMGLEKEPLPPPSANAQEWVPEADIPHKAIGNELGRIDAKLPKEEIKNQLQDLEAQGNVHLRRYGGR